MVSRPFYKLKGLYVECLCTIILSNLWEYELFSTFDFNGVGQHDGGAGWVLLDKKLS